jgi:hypothetical protein
MNGTKQGNITIIEKIESNNYKPQWLCQCDCGQQKIMLESKIKEAIDAGHPLYCSLTCRALMEAKKKIGETFGHLTVESVHMKNNEAHAMLACICGNKIERRLSMKREWSYCSATCEVQHRYKTYIGTHVRQILVDGITKDSAGQWRFTGICSCGRKASPLARKLLDGSVAGCGACKYDHIRKLQIPPALKKTVSSYSKTSFVQPSIYTPTTQAPALNTAASVPQPYVQSATLKPISVRDDLKKSSLGRTKDLTGQVIAGQKIIKFDHVDDGRSYWTCECPRCQKHTIKSSNALKEMEKKGKITYCDLSCGYRAEAEKSIGSTHNHLTVISINEPESARLKIIMVNAVCICGQKIVESLTKITQGKRESCSRQCNTIANYANLIGKKYGKLTVIHPKVAVRGEPYEGMVVLACKCDCGGSTNGPPSKLAHGSISSCGCLLSEYRSDFYGDKNPNWRDGSTEEIALARASQEYTDWRSAVFKKDNYTCCTCKLKSPSDGSGFSAHHLYNFSTHKELRYDIDNGVTLCRQCHIDFHAKFGNQNNTPEQFEEFKSA